MPTGKTHFPNPAARALSLFKQSPKPKSPAELVRFCVELLEPLAGRRIQPTEKRLEDVERVLEEMVHILYGDTETPPSPDAATQLAAEAFRGNFLSLLIKSVPCLAPTSRQPAAQIVSSLQRQRINSRLVAADYLGAHTDILDLLLSGYGDPEIALFYGSMLRDCLRHQEAARYMLNSGGLDKLFPYIEEPQFEVSSDAAATFKELLLRHKSTVAPFLVEHHKEFFQSYNKLLESGQYVTRRTAIKVLSDMLSDRPYQEVVARYAGDAANLRAVMNALKDSSKTIQMDAFHIFKIIVAHEPRAPEVALILSSNREKILRFVEALRLDKGSEQELARLEEEKKLVVWVVSSI